MNKLDMRTKPNELRVCKEHGKYLSRNVLKNIWTNCPTCTDIRAKEQEDDRKRGQAEERKKAWESKIKRACIPERFLDRTLDSYIATNPDQQRAKAICQHYSDNFSEVLKKGSSMILCGKPGTGKTHLAAGIAVKAMHEHGVLAVFSTVMRVVRRIKSTWSRDAHESEYQAIAAFTDPDLLILDELGVQFGSETEEHLLSDIINDRYENRKPTIVLSNLDKDGVKQYLGERAFDRFREDGGKLINFTWESYRGSDRPKIGHSSNTGKADEKQTN